MAAVEQCKTHASLFRQNYDCFWRQVKHTKDVMPESSPEVVVTVIGAASGFSRLVCGKISDLPGMNRIRLQVCMRRFDWFLIC